MTDQPSNIALLRLMAWLSPAFPVGGFSYSHGLERAVHDGLIADAGSLSDWLETLVEMGSGWNCLPRAGDARAMAVSSTRLQHWPRRSPARANATPRPCCKVRRS
jgi:urease accessory protein UreF